MGKGDRRSKRGKIAKGTFGKYRSAKPNKIAFAKATAVKETTEEKEKEETEAEAEA